MGAAHFVIAYIIPIAGVALIAFFAVLFFVLRYHWRRYAFDTAAARRFSLTFGSLGLLCSLGIVAGLIGALSS